MNELRITPGTITTWRHELREQKWIGSDDQLDLSQATEEEFLHIFFTLHIFRSNRTLSPHTIRAYQQDLHTLRAFLHGEQHSLKDVDFVVVQVYNRYINERYAKRTAVRRLDFFRRLLEFGHLTHYYSNPLAPWVQKPSVQKGHYTGSEQEQNGRTEFRELSEEEARLIVDILPTLVKSRSYKEAYEARNHLIGCLLLLTGMRSGELLSLNWGNFRSTPKGTIVVDIVGKGGKQRTVPVFKEVQEALFRYRQAIGETERLDPRDSSPLLYSIDRWFREHDKKRLGYTTLFSLIKRGVAKAGLNERISPHWFRHSFCTTSLAKDVPLAVVKQAMGHSSIATTNLYLERIHQDRLGEAFERAGYGI